MFAIQTKFTKNVTARITAKTPQMRISIAYDPSISEKENHENATKEWIKRWSESTKYDLWLKEEYELIGAHFDGGTYFWIVR